MHLECICIYNFTVPSSCDYICPPFLFSLAGGQESRELEGCQKRPARLAAETFTSQAGRHTESDRRRKGGKEKVRKTSELLSLDLSVSRLCVCLLPVSPFLFFFLVKAILYLPAFVGRG